MKISKETLEEWRDKAKAWLSARGHSCDAVKTGRDAWAVAHQSGIMQLAYRNPDLIDAHIQTALEQIFPNAVFLDKKVY